MSDYPDYGAAFGRLRARIAHLENALKVIRGNRYRFGHEASDFADEALDHRRA